MSYKLLNAPDIASSQRNQADVRTYGWVGDGITDDSHHIQNAIDAVHNSGGGTVYVPPGNAFYKFPVFVSSNVHVVHRGTTITAKFGSMGFALGCHYVLGDSFEFNRSITDLRRVRDDPATGYRKKDFADIPLSQYPEENDPIYGINGSNAARIQAVNCGVVGMHLKAHASVTGRIYGVWFGNVAQAYAREWEATGLTQSFSVGSDVTPSCPYALDCEIDRLLVHTPSQTTCYYGTGFMAHAKRCHVRRSKQTSGVPDGLANGNGLYGNLCVDCSFSEFVIICGRGANGDGVGFQSSKNCVISNGVVKDAVSAVQLTYRKDFYMPVPSEGCFVQKVTGVNCTNLIKTDGKYNRFVEVNGIRCKTDIYISNMNGTDNVFEGCDNTNIAPPAGKDRAWVRSHNKIASSGPTPKSGKVS